MIRLVGIINYGAGNLMSISKAISCLKLKPVIIETDKLEKCDMIILPGVGNFGSAMEVLVKRGLDEKIVDFFSRGRPILGICLGIQLVFESSEEAQNVKGLGLLKGKVKKFKTTNLPVPHMCWNIVEFKQAKDKTLLVGLKDKEYFYFVHSYYPVPKDKEVIFASTKYGIEFCSMIVKDNLVATQFHLEKSGNTGLKLLSNIINYFNKI